MRFPQFYLMVLPCILASIAVAAQLPKQQRQPTSLETVTRTFALRAPAATNPTKTNAPSATATASKKPKAAHKGLTKAAKIGIGVGVPLGVLALVLPIVFYIIGKKRGFKRKGDPDAGAGKWIRDPSDELNILPTTPLTAPEAAPVAVELPTVRSDEFVNRGKGGGGGWWMFGRQESVRKMQANAPQSPQELPA